MKALLLLADGTLFEGKALGAIGETTGELCFNTSMTGYQEIFTDPSYFGQILIHNHSHLGNYGISNFEEESDSIKIKGVICRNISEKQFRPLSEKTVQQYLEENGIVGIADIDTRALVFHIRNKGVMNAIISSQDLDIESLKSKLAKTPSMEGLELASIVSTTKPYTFGNADAEYNIGVMDFGIKKNILRNFENRNIRGTVYPAKTPASELLAQNYDAFFLSNGPGDPASMTYALETTTQLIQSKKPIFGICLGHQLIAQYAGLKTYKMHNGHRGGNHPVQNLETGKSEITTQNHGFAVDHNSINENMPVKITHINLNDKSLEGIRLTELPVFSVQYHPEAAPGPHDSQYLFDNFVELLQKHKNS